MRAPAVVTTRVGTEADRLAVEAFYAALEYRGGVASPDCLVLAEADGALIGVVRLACEHGVTVLRGMRVLPAYQRRGIGTALLRTVAAELDQAACYGIAYAHLKSLYALIGFREASVEETPPFLAERLAGYRTKRPDTALYAMFRPGSSGAAGARFRKARESVKAQVALHDVQDADLHLFFEHQADPVAHRIAAFPPRDEAAFMAHWTKIRADDTVLLRTIVFDGQVVGNIVSFDRLGWREVGYWIGREFWGQGIATRALSEFLTLEKVRPLVARVARHNGASLRVLGKFGFRVAPEGDGSAAVPGDEVEEVFLKLEK